MVTAATFSPPVKVASVSPRTVKRMRTLPTAFPALVSARVPIRWVNASPAIAASPVVPAFSRMVHRVGGSGLGTGLPVGGVGSVGLVLGTGAGLPEAGGLLGDGSGLGDAVLGARDPVFAPVRPGEGLTPVKGSSLRPTGRLPVPSGISWVPLR
ncbi:hypothetical protein STENM327S_09357 [Streptomyces tendae]